MSITSVRIKDELLAPLDELATRFERSRSWLINEALRQYIARQQQEAMRWQQTLSALESVSSGNVTDADPIHDWLRTWGTEGEHNEP